MILAVVFSVPTFAQKVELFGGAQYEHLQPSYNGVGWNVSLTGNFKHVLGITGDFSGVYNSHRVNSSVYTYTVGPVLTASSSSSALCACLVWRCDDVACRRERQRVRDVRWRRIGHRPAERDRIAPGTGRLAYDSIP